MIRLLAMLGEAGSAGALRRVAVTVLGCLLLWPLALLQPAAAGVPLGSGKARAWIDDTTGYAIGGYDPVDYFVFGRPNRPQLNEGVELFWGGVNWRFRNDGNRAAFLRHPSVYCPRFGAFDPVKLAAGVTVEAEPIHFDIFDNHLYLFHNAADLANWREDRERLLDTALTNWPELAKQQGFEHEEPEDPKPLTPKKKMSREQAGAAGMSGIAAERMPVPDAAGR